jgi:hypothetical protein
MIPLYGFLEGDTLGLLILAAPDDTMAKLAAEARVGGGHACRAEEETGACVRGRAHRA